MSNNKKKQNTSKKTNKSSYDNKKALSIIIPIFIVVATLVALFGFILPGKRYLINTAAYINWDETNKGYVETAMGKDNTEERFRTYFQWFNVIHEIGHGLIRSNNGVDIPIAEEEQLVNDFAVAYWRYYGNDEKLELIKDIVDYAVVNVGDNYKNGVDYMELGKANSTHEMFNNDFFNFEDYGWFQFSSVQKAIEKDLTLDEALKAMGITGYKLDNQRVLTYTMVEDNDSRKVIDDAYQNILDWGLEFNKPVQLFWPDPNLNSSSSVKNYFYIFDILDKITKI